MRRKFINKLILGTMVSTMLGTLVPVKASAEWVKDYQNNWYYTQNNVKMTGWKKIDGQLYYFDHNGKMITGWIQAGSSWYFLQNSGALKTGWINYNKNLYYTDSSGAMQTGIINIAGKIYILGDNGVLKTGSTVINGQFYTIGSDGEVVGGKVPTPDKEFDNSGNVVTVLKNTDNNVTTSPTDSKVNEVIKDQSVSDDDPNEGRTFKVSFKDSNGAELKTKTVKYGKSADLYKPTKSGYYFASWNTKSDGSGRSYATEDNINVKEDINLYAQWTEDTATYLDDITLSGSEYVTVGKTSQITATVSPTDATNTSVTWSVTDGTGSATIDSSGVLTGVKAGTVTVKATAADGSGVSATKDATVSATDVVIPVTGITVTSQTGKNAITVDKGILQMVAAVSPNDATSKDVTWSVESMGGSADIDKSTGKLTAISNGTIKVIVANSEGVTGYQLVTISGQTTTIPVNSMTISGKDGATAISTDANLGGTNGTLKMVANVLPITATNKTVKWSVTPSAVGISGETVSEGDASIDPDTGLLTAKANGYVKVTAVSQGNSLISAETIIKIENQTIRVTGITIAGKDGAKAISTDANLGETNGQLQMVANVQPTTATNNKVKWSVESKGGSAQIDADGLLTATTNGQVLVKATAQDGSNVFGSTTIEISGQTKVVPLTSITVDGKDGAATITTDNGTLQMIAELTPYNSTTTQSAVKWSVTSGTGSATINSSTGNSSTGVLTALTNGTVSVTAKATREDNTVIVSAPKTITISGQYKEITEIDVSPKNVQVQIGGILQMTSVISPDYATYKTVKWEVENITGGATITSAGVLTGSKAGTVTVRAVDAKNSATYGDATITIVEPVKVTGITVNAPADSNNKITTDAGLGGTSGTLQMSAAITNADTATNKAVTWSIEPYTGTSGTETAGSATIVDNGNLTAKLTAVSNGLVKVKATAKDGSGIVGEKVITISGQTVKATGYTVTGLGGSTVITTDDGILDMKAYVIPSNATTTPAAVTWTVEPYATGPSKVAGKATINQTTGSLQAVLNGDVQVKATGTTTDGTAISGVCTVTLSGQSVPITSISGITTPSSTTITGGVPTIKKGNALQMSATIDPTYATEAPTWTVSNTDESIPGNCATITNSGLLMGVSAGTVTVTATAANDATKSIFVNVTAS